MMIQRKFSPFELGTLQSMIRQLPFICKRLDTVLKKGLTTQAPYAKLSQRPLNIAHRGLAGLFPQNTKESFEAALYSGADFIELDVVFTKDDHLLVMHDPYLSRITDAHKTDLSAVKAKRYYATEQREIEDGWTDLFTLQELRKLTIKQDQAKDRNTSLDWRFGFSTLDQVIELVKKFNKLHKGKRNPDGRLPGILIEAKDGDMYRQVYGDKKISIGKKILDVLKQHDVDSWEKSIDHKCPIYLHSFDNWTVEEWHRLGSNLPRNLLIEVTTHPKNLTLLEYIKQATSYAHGVGLQSTFLWDHFSKTPKHEVIEEIRKLDMLLHIWTFKDDDRIFDASNPHELYRIGQNQMKLDGVITEFPDVYAAVSHYLAVEAKLTAKKAQAQLRKQQVGQVSIS